MMKMKPRSDLRFKLELNLEKHFPDELINFMTAGNSFWTGELVCTMKSMSWCSTRGEKVGVGKFLDCNCETRLRTRENYRRFVKKNKFLRYGGKATNFNMRISVYSYTQCKKPKRVFFLGIIYMLNE